mgnify:CR=1 FL=1
MQFRIQAAGVAVPASLLLMLPYVFTIIVLVISSAGGFKRSSAPEALGERFARGEKG